MKRNQLCMFEVELECGMPLRFRAPYAHGIEILFYILQTTDIWYIEIEGKPFDKKRILEIAERL